jgi:signal recognition particle subunit SRP54
VRVEAMIQSMTRQERKQPDLIDKSRATRIAKGSGMQQSQVRDLVKRFGQMREMMAALGGGGAGGLLGKIPGMGRLAGAGGLDPSMLAGMGDPGGVGRGKAQVAKARSKSKKKRKQARKDRKKGRRK